MKIFPEWLFDPVILPPKLRQLATDKIAERRPAPSDTDRDGRTVLPADPIASPSSILFVAEA
jgi:hypothetical protein